MKSWESPLPYFTQSELACHHCGLIKLDLVFAAALVSLRHTWNAPLTPTSVCRCPAHNEDSLGHPRSLHLTENPVHQTEGCAAIDIDWSEWPRVVRLKFARLAWSKGWSIGLSKQFIHLDARALIKNVHLAQKIYVYDSWRFQFGRDEIKKVAL